MMAAHVRNNTRA